MKGRKETWATDNMKLILSDFMNIRYFEPNVKNQWCVSSDFSCLIKNVNAI